MPADEGTDADLAGLADAGLARWVAEVRQASGRFGRLLRGDLPEAGG